MRLTVTADLDRMAADGLWLRASTASVFNHPAWWASAQTAFGTERRLHVLSLNDDTGKLVALWPLWLKRLGAKEGFATIVEPLGARVTDYVMPLIDAGTDSAAAIQMLLVGADQALGPGTLLLWPKVPVAAASPGSIGAIISGVCVERGLLSFTRDRPCLSMTLPPSFAELEQRWSRRHRVDVRRQTKRLAREGKVALHVAASREEILARLPFLYAMHAENWGTRTGVSEFAQGDMATFVTRLAAELPLDLLHYSELRLNGEALSCHLGFRDRGALLWYKPTYNLAGASFAPGKLHIASAAKWGIEHGIRAIDFLQGTESYKMRWADSCTQTTSWAIARRAAYPFWVWNTAVRNLAIEYRV
jgi:CelD/BcsL family acetyltransferase involved in cellulose biosynthesis